MSPIAADDAVVVKAPAKINLDLLVTGRRADGYHEIDSIVVFGDHGDCITVQPSDRLNLDIQGPMAQALQSSLDDPERNLVLRAARHLASIASRELNVAILLEKHLPVASGIGGGSSNAAATLKALRNFWELSIDDVDLRDIGLPLGADVPVCLYGRPARMRGIGERLDPVRGLPILPMLLVNPGCSVSTRDVFAQLELRAEPATREPLSPMPSIVRFVHWLEANGNDLERPALKLEPTICEVLEAFREMPDCMLARMSGSGATCFGIFKDPSTLAQAKQQMAHDHPDWWIAATQSEPS